MNNQKMFGAAAMLAFVSLAACNAGAAGDDGFTPPSVGTQLNWKYDTGDGNIDDSKATVVATGPDFAIYHQRDGDDANSDYYFAEFSGIDYAGCDEDDMPSAANRATLRDMWPPTTGATYTRGTTKISVENESTYLLDSEKIPVVQLRMAYLDGEEKDDILYLSEELKTVVWLKWGAGGVDSVVSVEQADMETQEVQPGYTVQKGLSLAALDNCSGLLSESASSD